MVGAVGTRVGQAKVFAVGNIPAEGTRVGQSRTTALLEASVNVRASQLKVLALARGRVSDPKVRAWTFTLDGHDYYVLRLGNSETLVYDTHSEQWYIWGSEDSDLWRAYNGANWLGGNTFASDYGSNVLVGDDGNGSLYFLNPYGETDDDAVQGSNVSRQYIREVQGQLHFKGYGSVPNFRVSVLGSIGQVDDPSLTSVTLSYSDDRGDTYVDAGSITIPKDDLDVEVNWRGLGSMKKPGRLFKITDYGALKRIDSITGELPGEG